MLDLVHAVEGIGILGDEIYHLIEPLHELERRAREWFYKSCADTIALGVPLVLLCDCSTDAVKAGIQRAVTIKRTDKTAKQRGQRDAVVETRATVGAAQLDGWILHRTPHCPTGFAFVRNELGPFECRDELPIVAVGANHLRQSRARKLIVGGQPVADETGQMPLPEWR